MALLTISIVLAVIATAIAVVPAAVLIARDVRRPRALTVPVSWGTVRPAATEADRELVAA